MPGHQTSRGAKERKGQVDSIVLDSAAIAALGPLSLTTSRLARTGRACRSEHVKLRNSSKSGRKKPCKRLPAAPEATSSMSRRVIGVTAMIGKKGRKRGRRHRKGERRADGSDDEDMHLAREEMSTRGCTYSRHRLSHKLGSQDHTHRGSPSSFRQIQNIDVRHLERVPGVGVRVFTLCAKGRSWSSRCKQGRGTCRAKSKQVIAGLCGDFVLGYSI